MVYHKIPFQNGSSALVELYDDEIVTFCANCSKEIQLDPSDIVQIFENGGDFGGTAFYCSDCTQKGGDQHALN